MEQRYIPALIDLNDLGGPKMVLETLSMVGVSGRTRDLAKTHMERLQKLAQFCDDHRPVDPQTLVHGDSHTPTCGCDKMQYDPESSRLPEVIAFYSNEDLLYKAWTVIANVSEGNWADQTEEWQMAAARWRNEFHDSLKD